MLTTTDWQNLSTQEKQQKLSRPKQALSFKTQVQAIIHEVKSRGDDALFAFTREFDGIDLTDLKVSAAIIKEAEISSKASIALNQAIETIRTYHQAMMPYAKQVTTAEGVVIERTYRPISRVGLYVPGGHNTPLVSSLLMQAIPAQVAGCPLKVLCTPPNHQGEIDPHLLVAARLCGIDTIYRIGGAQAIAAMAYGTETIPKMDKLFGPGNRYVTEAKTLVAADSDGAAIDMPAGPSEVMILADEEANPDFVAADLLAQAEHGIDSQVILICESEEFAFKVKQKLKQQMLSLSRQAILKQALQQGAILICTDPAEQINIINSYAPEHLIINRRNAKELVPHIVAAGTVFLGQWAAETMGDYVTGSNHVLPTHGYARNHSGLCTLDFLNALTVQSVTAEGVKSLGEAAETLALIEGLDAHANAIKLRLNQLGEF
ncbi:MULTISPECIES: histidinol dehydrogenase [Legionella]|uniref:Histidinol dehydrogenase n=1 Tax=Legionella maceachernii TaxID=466 RepID=A0A0W0VYH4_9GAMM|nr:histidinol dehydrogenase [Legionella maceachernii]KTD25232.1 histidinol dehydrogenase [Legionella maceachernii]SJZ76934.1 histidinol dehydrogenase [Legionella maceachernii]SUP03071.1 Histidinol dehydrogenase [Legionella maceachernii]